MVVVGVLMVAVVKGHNSLGIPFFILAIVLPLLAGWLSTSNPLIYKITQWATMIGLLVAIGIVIVYGVSKVRQKFVKKQIISERILVKKGNLISMKQKLFAAFFFALPLVMNATVIIGQIILFPDIIKNVLFYPSMGMTAIVIIYFLADVVFD